MRTDPIWTDEELTANLEATAAWVRSYLAGLEDRPVAEPVEPGAVRARLPAAPPTDPEPFGEILADLDRVITPALVHWQHPGFLAWFPAQTSGASILAELVSAALGVNGMLWATSPAATELETHVLDWMATALGLPDRFRSDGPGGGVIQDSASSATLVSLVAARHRAGGDPDRHVLYASAEAHSSVPKAARIAGYRAEQLRLIPTDTEGAMRTEALAATVEADVATGLQPVWCVATAGTTGRGAFDPVAEIARVMVHHGTWIHVDAAWAGTAAVCPELRWINTGLDRVDSYCTNPHKSLLVNFDCDCMWVADRRALTDALAVEAEYLRTATPGAAEVIDYRDWQIPLGRRFRALKLWFVLRGYGTDALAAFVRRQVGFARELEASVRAHPDLELVAPVRLTLVCFAHRSGDAATRALIDGVNASGRAFLSHTTVDGRLVARMAVGASRAERHHLLAAWRVVDDTARRVR